MNKITENVINIAKLYFERIDKVAMAFLFGSYASGNICSESDVDIAVLMESEDNKLEIKINNDIEQLLHKEVDIINLSRSTPVLSWSILRKGIPLVIKNRKKYLDFMLDVSREAEDFIEFNLDTWREKYDTRTSR